MCLPSRKQSLNLDAMSEALSLRMLLSALSYIDAFPSQTPQAKICQQTDPTDGPWAFVISTLALMSSTTECSGTEMDRHPQSVSVSGEEVTTP